MGQSAGLSSCARACVDNEACGQFKAEESKRLLLPGFRIDRDNDIAGEVAELMDFTFPQVVNGYADMGKGRLQADPKDSGSDALPTWSVGSRYVIQQNCCLMEVPKKDARQLAELSTGTVVILLRTEELMTGPGQQTLWGLLDPPRLGAGPTTAGWASLEVAGAVVGPQTPLRRRLLEATWEVGTSYLVREGTLVRAGVDLSTDLLASLQEGETVEVLALAAYMGPAHMFGMPERLTLARLRAKVLTSRARTVGWLSPRNENGHHLLHPVQQSRLLMTGRSTVEKVVVASAKRLE